MVGFWFIFFYAVVHVVAIGYGMWLICRPLNGGDE